MFVRGTVPGDIKGNQVEVYGTARYIAVTGHQWPGTSDDLQPAQPYLDKLWCAFRSIMIAQIGAS